MKRALMNRLVTKDNVTKVLDRYVGSRAPGLQYIVVNAAEHSSSMLAAGPIFRIGKR